MIATTAPTAGGITTSIHFIPIFLQQKRDYKNKPKKINPDCACPKPLLMINEAGAIKTRSQVGIPPLVTQV
jgi:hypothetical protein